MKVRNRLTRVVFAYFFAHISGLAGDAVAWVTQCTGAWEVQTDAARPIKIRCNGPTTDLWFRLSRQSKLARAAHKSGDWVDIRIARTGEIHRFDCDKPGECERSLPAFIQLIPREQTVGVLESFLHGADDVYLRFRLTLSRSENDGVGRITVDHAVATAGIALRLHDLIRPTAPPGEYLLELCPFDPEKGCPQGQAPTSVTWRPNSSALWPQPATPGLFEIVLSRVNDDGITTRTDDRGLLLVVPKQNETKAREQVKAGEELFLGSWTNKSEGRLMFSALLLYIASTEVQ